MTDRGTDPGYLEEAAAELRKARDANEKRRGMLEEVASYDRELAARLSSEVADRSLELGNGFIRLAAIKAGMNEEDSP